MSTGIRDCCFDFRKNFQILRQRSDDDLLAETKTDTSGYFHFEEKIDADWFQTEKPYFKILHECNQGQYEGHPLRKGCYHECKLYVSWVYDVPKYMVIDLTKYCTPTGTVCP
ncbi:transthyretin-like family domain-containing protein [Ditylenchus destructor]|uniref:Transthyretin-like family domain-containing protein n=1 Tax=Ditylenchus destructor TaxID=166010 RepID=A0AAD4QTD8_9BILA|nr:transthyretin-like family domain-containing protein [Ditylenchus destructor]